VSITPGCNALPALPQLLNINPSFGLARAPLVIPPVCTKRTDLKVKVNEMICYRNIFFLMLLKSLHIPGKEKKKTFHESKFSPLHFQCRIGECFTKTEISAREKDGWQSCQAL